MEAFEDRWIQFRCTADGQPKPEIKWAFKGNMIGSRIRLSKWPSDTNSSYVKLFILKATPATMASDH